jgi:steroid delta-isomerase-like uncharacterized protein
MTSNSSSDAAKAVVRRNTEEVQGGGNFEVFDELFADDFLDHTPQPGRTPDKDGARQLYKLLRTAFPDFHADIHWQLADGDRVTTYKTYHGTHRGEFLGVAPTGRKIQFETVDVMRVRNGKIAEHWGVANLFSLMQQLGAWPALARCERPARNPIGVPRNPIGDPSESIRSLSMTKTVSSSLGADAHLPAPQRNKMRCVQVQIGPADIDGLIAKGYLSPLAGSGPAQQPRIPAL